MIVYAFCRPLPTILKLSEIELRSGEGLGEGSSVVAVPLPNPLPKGEGMGATELDLPGDGSLSPGNGLPIGDSGLTDMGHDGHNREVIVEES